MVELVQVKVFFCFPMSEVPTFVGSPDCRESRLTPEVPTAGSPGVRREFQRRSDRAVSFLTSPVLSFTVVISSSSPPVAPPPPSLLLAPPRRTQPPPPLFPRRGPCRLPLLSPLALVLPPKLSFFPSDRGALAIGVEESFGGGDCARGFVRRRLRLIFSPSLSSIQGTSMVP